jgi:hypothetical protein
MEDLVMRSYLKKFPCAFNKAVGGEGVVFLVIDLMKSCSQT